MQPNVESFCMQPIKYLGEWLSKHTNHNHYLFSAHDLSALFPELSTPAFKTLLSRAVRSKLLIHVCRGIYLYKKSLPPDGLLLYHTASLLRSNTFNYISLETALSDAGIISQIPMNQITIMSSGRSNTISCGNYGTIEFIHTTQQPCDLINQLTYDHRCGMWRAKNSLALRDMKSTRRHTDLIDWNNIDEFI